MNTNELNELFKKYKLPCGRMISGSKTAPKGHTCVWNANIVIKSQGKIWYGDLDVSKEGDNLKRIADIIDEIIYVLRERDCRFGTENDKIDTLIQNAVWNTNMKIIEIET